MAEQAGGAVVCMGGLIVGVAVLIVVILSWLSKGGSNGLSSTDHGRLNSYNWQQDATPENYRQIRQQYRGDARAQRQIDIYGGSQEYRAKMASYRSALKSGNEQRAAKLERWFKRNGYNDV